MEDEAVKEAMAARDLARTDRDCTPCEETREEYRVRRNAVKLTINRACSSFYAMSFRNSRSKTWKDIRRFLVSSNKSTAAAAAAPDPEWANRQNRFFASVGPAVADALAGSGVGETLSPRPPRVCSGSFKPHPVTLPELSAALQRMGASRASGEDGITVETALLDAVSFATDQIDKGMVTSLVTADTSKAFDSVEHGRLLDKLGWYGIHPEWFSAWLCDRTQTVRGGTEVQHVTHGVVQGSILGPVLFLLATNDLPQHVPFGKIVMYADDNQFLDSDLAANIHTLKARVEASLSVALKWFTQNRLKINPSKTEFLILRSRRQKIDSDLSLAFGDYISSPSRTVKVLGVVIDSHL